MQVYEATKSKYVRQREKNDEKIYNEYNELMNVPGAMATAVESFLMNKYKIHARSTIWQIRKRVERLKKSTSK